jgi:hypothetical protein
MEPLNSISSQGLKRLEFLYGFYPYFQFYKRLFMRRLEFSCFDDIFVRIFKTREEYGVFPSVEGTVKSMEQKTRVKFWCPRILSQYSIFSLCSIWKTWNNCFLRKFFNRLSWVFKESAWQNCLLDCACKATKEIWFWKKENASRLLWITLFTVLSYLFLIFSLIPDIYIFVIAPNIRK